VHSSHAHRKLLGQIIVRTCEPLGSRRTRDLPSADGSCGHDILELPELDQAWGRRNNVIDREQPRGHIPAVPTSLLMLAPRYSGTR